MLMPMRNSIWRSSGIAALRLPHQNLNFNRKGGGFNDAGKLHQRAVPHQFDDAAVVLGSFRVNQLCTMCLECRQRAHFVLTHKAAVADHVGG